ncbi:hypothetical protein AC578_10785 [Pseudocercospora eumusae]|uniref:Cytochrome P450 n=1 Tax=Pseudocercospora eumusae TaxID=321146 RepID=A0A139H3S8_9PEZI|nr:hypothetical protein AC578_10785 [Pseudocercospora eumusae]
MDTRTDLNSSGEPLQLNEPSDAIHHIFAQLIEAKAPSLGLYAAVVITVLLGAQALQYIISRLRRPRLPTINKFPWDPFGDKAKTQYLSHAKKLIQDGFKKFGERPFYLRMEVDKTVLLPPQYIEAVNKEDGLSFIAFTTTHFLSQYDTFKGLDGNTSVPGHFEEAVMKGLTRSLPRFTIPISREMTGALKDTWGDNKEWHEVWVRGDVLKWVARLSARIFVGDPLASDETWLRISREYTSNLFGAVDKVKAYPRPLWWIVERLHPLARQAREDRRQAKQLLEPYIAARNEEIARAEKEGRKPDVPDDSLEWFRTAAKGRPYKDLDIQLGLTNAAIHTTSDLIGQSVLNLCKYPEVIPHLREEVIEVLQKYGWQKIALTEVRLLDSFLKETQRIKPVGMVFMARKATRNITLPGGLNIPKGTDTAVSSHKMWSPDIWGDDHDQFNAWRFVERRKQPQFQNSSLLVSTCPEFTAFGHGKHACPGRFFAANEVKIAMMHLLIKYDFKFDNPKDADWLEFGVTMLANPAAKIWVRAREPEIDLDAIEGTEAEA